ncbi:MAG: hypothetical protein R3246_14620, partial [Acidimicrobiia bacterium]|nr:hypothetical protein [Acidimicrobiia bacterium]
MTSRELIEQIGTELGEQVADIPEPGETLPPPELPEPPTIGPPTPYTPGANGVFQPFRVTQTGGGIAWDQLKKAARAGLRDGYDETLNTEYRNLQMANAWAASIGAPHLNDLNYDQFERFRTRSLLEGIRPQSSPLVAYNLMRLSEEHPELDIAALVEDDFDLAFRMTDVDYFKWQAQRRLLPSGTRLDYQELWAATQDVIDRYAVADYQEISRQG